MRKKRNSMCEEIKKSRRAAGWRGLGFLGGEEPGNMCL